MRVLIYVHGHPKLKPGGSEVAAYALFQALGRVEGLEPYFLAAAPKPDGSEGLQPFGQSGREFLLPPQVADHFFFRTAERGVVTRQVIALIERLEIEVLHLHHFLGLGVDTVLQIRNRFPSLRMVFTAHEYLSLCARDGQMLRSSGRLCEQAAPVACAACLPQHGEFDFEVRHDWFGCFFDCFQAVLSPSAFLAERLIAGGLAARKLSVVENLHPKGELFRREAAPASDRLNRFGFFAQINAYKGATVLLDAADRLRAQRPEVQFHLFGGFSPDPAFEALIRQRLATLPDLVRYHGAYLPDGILPLMQSVDWVIVPSIWWENAPTVIEEALIAGRPVLASDIGGMREKVRDGLDGLHFPVGDGAALAALVTRIAGDRALWQRLVASRRPVAREAEVVARHLAVYRGGARAAAQAVA